MCDKLLKVFPDHDDLVNALKHRFKGLPIHDMCYYQSYHPTDQVLANLHQIKNSDAAAGYKTDSFGMTPFHILALSAKPNLDLFQALYELYPVDLINGNDKWGRTTLDYLCMNIRPNSNAFTKAILDLSLARRLKHLGLERWRSAIENQIDVLLNDESSSRTSELDTLLTILAKQERLEVTSLLELVVWKLKIDDVVLSLSDDAGNENIRKRARVDESASFSPSRMSFADRGRLRFNCKADIVIPNVLSFLGSAVGEEDEVEA